MSDLLVKAERTPGEDGRRIEVTPESAGWGHVGFEVLDLGPGRAAGRNADGVEVCLVAVAGSFDLTSTHGEFGAVGSRPDPFTGTPDAVYLPPGGEWEATAGPDGCELAICTAPAEKGAEARVLRGDDMEVEIRGHGSQQRTIHKILMGDQAAESLLICEVLTPGGNWSSYPPHKHDQDDLPRESFLEETYYHRVTPEQGFAMQRVYTDEVDGERELDESVAAHDGDVVLVPKGYHTVSAPPGYDLYYLNVMAGPSREWAIANDPAHEWTLEPQNG